MGRPAFKGASFDPSAAEKAPVPPAVFKSLSISCPVCTVSLINRQYVFFPSSLYVEGYCVRCQDTRSAFFAPEPEDMQPQQTSASVPPEAEAAIDDFLVFLAAQTEDTTPRGPRRIVNPGTDLDEGDAEPISA